MLGPEIESEVMADPVGDLPVFHGFQAAGREQDRRGGPEQGLRLANDALLETGDRSEGVRVEAVSGFGTAGEDPGVAAGHVEHEKIGLAHDRGEFHRVHDFDSRVVANMAMRRSFAGMRKEAAASATPNPAGRPPGKPGAAAG